MPPNGSAAVTSILPRNRLAAFDPGKLSVLLQNLPEGAIIYGLAPTGPAVAMPRAMRREDEIIGAVVYDSCEILIWTGARYSPLYRLTIVDGRPTLVDVIKGVPQ